jgi:hypothetical protein
MRVENPKLVVEPGAGRTGKLAMVAYQFQQISSRYTKLGRRYVSKNCVLKDNLPGDDIT